MVKQKIITDESHEIFILTINSFPIHHSAAAGTNRNPPKRTAVKEKAEMKVTEEEAQKAAEEVYIVLVDALYDGREQTMGAAVAQMLSGSQSLLRNG